MVMSPKLATTLYIYIYIYISNFRDPHLINIMNTIIFKVKQSTLIEDSHIYSILNYMPYLLNIKLSILQALITIQY
jgi:hypothetical protein